MVLKTFNCGFKHTFITKIIILFLLRYNQNSDQSQQQKSH